MLKSIVKISAIALISMGLIAEAEAQTNIKVAMITSESGLGDKSFNDMMAEGMERAKTELGIEYVIIQPRSVSDFQSTLVRAAGQGFDVIVASSFDMIKPMQAAAAAFPDQKFGLVDVGPEPLGPNIASTVTKDWEGSFLMGYIAAKTTKTGTIGFVGGKDIPVIHRFSVGYIYGAAMADPAVKVLETYSGSFTDPAGGKEFALALINQHSDINYAVAGATGAGVIDAAKQTGTFAIGVDSNQNYMAPGSVLTSMMKRVDNEAYTIIKSVIDGKFEGNKVTTYGLAEGGVEAAMDDNNKGLIADSTLADIEVLKAKLLSGEIVVPNFFDLKPGDKVMGTPPLPTPPYIADAQ